jgi:hypothetical protein
LLALYPTVVPIAFSQFLNPDHSVRSWLTAMNRMIAPWVTEALAVPVNPVVAPVVTEAAPVLKKARKSTKAADTKNSVENTPRKRSPKTKAAQ